MRAHRCDRFIEAEAKPLARHLEMSFVDGLHWYLARSTGLQVVKERELPKPLADAIIHNHHWNQLFSGVFDEPMLLGVLTPHMRNLCYAFAHKETLGKTPTLLYWEH